MLASTPHHRPRAVALLLALTVATSGSLLACRDGAAGDGQAAVTTAAPATTATEPAGSEGRPTTSGSAVPATSAAAPATPTTSAATASAGALLTQAEIDGLEWMREEEKLALDVYDALAAQWGARIFDNISDSEQTHTDAVLALLDRYGIVDPAAGRAPGAFTDPAIQALYDHLVAQGGQSLAAALEVGATIEDLDIVDLQQRATTTPDIAAVYANLEKGSRNHLRSFVSQLAALGIDYAPQHLTAEAYEAIIDSAIERSSSA